MRRWLAALVVWGLLASAPAWAAQVRTVVVEGRGGTAREALEDALRNAAEQTVGVLVSAETEMQALTVSSDRVRTQAEAYVERYEILAQHPEAGLQWLRASVTINLDTIQDSLHALAILARRKHDPTFAVVELDPGPERADQEATLAAVGTVNRYLAAKLLEVRDPAVVAAARAEQESAAPGDSPEARARRIAAKLKADVYVTVVGHVARSASLDVKFYEAATGRILGEQSGYAVARSGALADMKAAVEQATQTATDKAFATLLTYWRRDTAQGSPITVVVNGLDFERKTRFRKLLADLTGQARQRVATPGHAEFEVLTSMSPEQLAEAIVEAAPRARLELADQGLVERGNRLVFSFR